MVLSMQVIYAGEELPTIITKSIFLAGPTARTHPATSWRLEALSYLKDAGYDGVVFVPEDRNGKFSLPYHAQVNWEETGLKVADCIVFWVPRSETLPGLTTNVEWGVWCQSGKAVLGYPAHAKKMNYLKHYAELYGVFTARTLPDTLRLATNKIGLGAERKGGERYVPLHVWSTASFQAWYTSQVKAGNRLDYADLLYTYWARSYLFLWILKVSVYVTAENRIKKGEFVVSRPDICSVMMWCPRADWSRANYLPSEVVLVKEFRSPARTQDGFIRELPGGSSFTPKNPLDVALEEVLEETGFVIKPERMIFQGERQLMGTLSSHTCLLYSVCLTQEEIQWFKSQRGIVHGDIAATERTFIEVHTIESLIINPITDWATLGQILSVTNRN